MLAARHCRASAFSLPPRHLSLAIRFHATLVYDYAIYVSLRHDDTTLSRFALHIYTLFLYADV